MLADISERCNTIEECYEFMLAYAAQGLPGEAGRSGGQIREYLFRAVRAISGLTESCATAMKQEHLEPAERCPPFFAVLDRDAHDSLAAIELVLAQPALSSQLIDNLNASIHLRALPPHLFPLSEIANTHRRAAKPMALGG